MSDNNKLAELMAAQVAMRQKIANQLLMQQISTTTNKAEKAKDKDLYDIAGELESIINDAIHMDKNTEKLLLKLVDEIRGVE